jgi:hypothetical protein
MRMTCWISDCNKTIPPAVVPDQEECITLLTCRDNAWRCYVAAFRGQAFQWK